LPACETRFTCAGVTREKSPALLIRNAQPLYRSVDRTIQFGTVIGPVLALQFPVFSF
jgi:hypothetical protein